MQVSRARVSAFRVGAGLLLCCPFTSCNGVVGADVSCDNICITAAGPTVPGLPALPDAGSLLAGLLSQPAKLQFNVPLQQLAALTAGVEVEAYLSSLKLMGDADLAFVDTLQVILRSGSGKGGSADAATPPKAADDSSGAGVPPGSYDDAGTSPMANELPHAASSLCLPGGPGLVVGSYTRSAAATNSAGGSLDLVSTTQEVNLFECFRGAPSSFEAAVSVIPALLPASSTPLRLKVCIRAHASASYP
jgi:hypothetical protein